jgi:hypothetical protein
MPETNRAQRSETSYDPTALVETIQQLERENEALRHELWKHKQKPAGKIGYLLLFSGAIVLILSIIYTSHIPAFIGISLTFWGALLLFIKPTKYVKASLLESTAISTFTNINRIIASMNYRGKGIYLPPKYSKGPTDGTVFIPTKEERTIPSVEEVAQEKIFLENPKGICLTPSGLDLTNLYEEEFGIDFTKSSLEYLQNKLPKLFIEGLEIAKTFEMEKRENNIHVKISDSIYTDFCNEAKALTKNACNSFACPLCSSIACALTRVTGKPVIIKKTSFSADRKTMHVYYQILGTIKKVSMPSKPTMRHTGILLPNLVELISAILGSIILAWVGWLTWYDMTTWSKDLALIFFGPRTGEAMSLGIGIRGIHYFLIGATLFLSSILMFFRKRQGAHVED